MNNGLLFFAGLLVLVLSALFAVPSFVDWNGYRGVFEEEASKVLGRDVRVGGAVNLRFLPAPYVQFDKVRIEVSLLSEPEFLEFRDEADALAQLRPGVDGVIFFNGCQKATFLPQVWEQLPDKASFMAALKQKARLPVDFWGPNVMIAVYQVQKWYEPPPSRD